MNSYFGFNYYKNFEINDDKLDLFMLIRVQRNFAA